jgi:ankyrin repeat protein
MKIIILIISLFTLSIQGMERPTNPIFKAIESNSIDKVSLAIEDGASSTTSNNKGDTPLHYAIKQEASCEIIDLLLSNNALVNQRNAADQIPLHLAAERAKSSLLINMLINAKSDINAKDNRSYTPLAYAVPANKYDVINTLIKAKANLSAQGTAQPVKKSIVESSILHKTQNSDLVHMLLADFAPQKDLSENLDKSTQLVPAPDLADHSTKKVEKSTVESSVLNRTQNSDLVHMFPDDFAPQKDLSENLDKSTELVPELSLNTDFWDAITSGYSLEKIGLLIQSKADINTQDNNHNNCLIKIVQTRIQSPYPLFEFLLQNNANPNHTNALRKSALHEVITQGRGIDIVKLLLEAKADLTLMNHRGYTPLKDAQRKLKFTKDGSVTAFLNKTITLLNEYKNSTTNSKE